VTHTFFYAESSPFSQWYRCEFRDGPLKFNCAEQYMMHRKARLFDDGEIASAIMRAQHPREQKALGRMVRGFSEFTWRRHREQIVFDGNWQKFTANPDLLRALRATCGTQLAQASPYDPVWGIGVSTEHARAIDPSEWPGLNLLGKILDQLREWL
jgi:ribA/ribD-fused uncharacterized protein